MGKIICIRMSEDALAESGEPTCDIDEIFDWVVGELQSLDTSAVVHTHDLPGERVITIGAYATPGDTSPHSPIEELFAWIECGINNSLPATATLMEQAQFAALHALAAPASRSTSPRP